MPALRFDISILMRRNPKKNRHNERGACMARCQLNDGASLQIQALHLPLGISVVRQSFMHRCMRQGLVFRFGVRTQWFVGRELVHAEKLPRSRTYSCTKLVSPSSTSAHVWHLATFRWCASLCATSLALCPKHSAAKALPLPVRR